MYSLNAPVPAEVARLASGLARELPGARARARGEHTLLVKRLGDGAPGGVDALLERARTAIAGTEPFTVSVTGVDFFAEPETGTSPVVYLAVESPPLAAVHHRLCRVFEPVEHLEGEAYVPHVTIARDGEIAAAERLATREIEPRTFEVTELVVWDAERGVPTTRLSLPV